jgi:hypothetical protein
MGQTQKGRDQITQLCEGVATKLFTPEILARPDVSKATLAKIAKMSRPTFYRHLQAMGLGEGGTPLDVEDRINYIGENFSGFAIQRLKDYALEEAFYRRKTVKRDYDNSKRAAKAKTLHRAKAKQTKNDVEVQAQANDRLLAEVGALTGQKTNAPARKEVKATRALPFDPEGKIQTIIAPVTSHMMQILTHYYIQNTVRKPLGKRWSELKDSPTAVAAATELKALANSDPRVDLEKWALWYYITHFTNKEVREQIARSLRVGHFDGVPDEKKWPYPLFLACQGLGIAPEWL